MNLSSTLRSPLRDIVVGKIWGAWEEKYFSNVLRSLKKLCILSQNQLSSDILYMFTLQLAVVTARMFIMERFIEFYFEIGLNKVIEQSVLSSRHGLKD